jgi:hypothetical protein
MTGTLHEDVPTLTTASRWILLRMRNILGKTCRENKNTNYVFRNFFSRKSRCLLDNAKKCGGDWGATNYATVWNIRVASWISKATCTQANAYAHAPSHPRTSMLTRTKYEYVVHIAFHGKNGFVNAPRCYVIRILPVRILSFLGAILFFFRSPVTYLTSWK